MPDHGPDDAAEALDVPDVADPRARHETPGPRNPVRISRRRLILLGASAALGAAGAGVLASRRPLWPSNEPTAAGSVELQADRILVTIQLAGGLDFLDTIVPSSARYRDLRGPAAIDPASVLPLDADYGFHPSLPGLARRWQADELAIVHGVGVPDPSLSHFVDTAVWERGAADPAETTGWLGRALGALAGADADPLLGVSIDGLTPSMYGPGWNPVALPADGRLPWNASFIEEHPGLVAAYRHLLAAPASSMPDTSLAERVRMSQRVVRDVADAVGGATDLDALARASELLEEAEEGLDEDEYLDHGLGQRLGLVADLINGGLPTRAYHVTYGDFDTHADQASSFPSLLGELDSALADFDRRLGANRDRVVIATWTEFGRRPEFNGSGTDHGTAGTQLVIGPAVRRGHHGDPVRLDRFDDDGNFLVTTDFAGYLGGLAEGVLGVDAARVVGAGAEPIEVVA